MLLRGYGEAFSRFKAAVKDDDNGVPANFAPLFEALNWAVVVGGDDAPMLRYPARSHEWLWRNADELPRPKRQDHEGEAVYRRLLQGHTAEDTLGILGEVFDDVWRHMVFPGSLGMPRRGSGADRQYRDLGDHADALGARQNGQGLRPPRRLSLSSSTKSLAERARDKLAM
jgi:hypothetical protein